MAQAKFDTYQYAHEAAKNGLTVKEILLKIKEKECKLEDFLISYTVFKTGKFTEENYAAVVTQFKQEAAIEKEKIMAKYSSHTTRVTTYGFLESLATIMPYIAQSCVSDKGDRHFNRAELSFLFFAQKDLPLNWKDNVEKEDASLDPKTNGMLSQS